MQGRRIDVLKKVALVHGKPAHASLRALAAIYHLAILQVLDEVRRRVDIDDGRIAVHMHRLLCVRRDCDFKDSYFFVFEKNLVVARRGRYGVKFRFPPPVEIA